MAESIVAEAAPVDEAGRARREQEAAHACGFRRLKESHVSEVPPVRDLPMSSGCRFPESQARRSGNRPARACRGGRHDGKPLAGDDPTQLPLPVSRPDRPRMRLCMLETDMFTFRPLIPRLGRAASLTALCMIAPISRANALDCPSPPLNFHPGVEAQPLLQPPMKPKTHHPTPPQAAQPVPNDRDNLRVRPGPRTACLS